MTAPDLGHPIVRNTKLYLNYMILEQITVCVHSRQICPKKQMKNTTGHI